MWCIVVPKKYDVFYIPSHLKSEVECIYDACNTLPSKPGCECAAGIAPINIVDKLDNAQVYKCFDELDEAIAELERMWEGREG